MAHCRHCCNHCHDWNDGNRVNQLRAALSALINRKGPISKRELSALMFENPEPHTLSELEALTRAVNRAMGPYKAPQFAAQEIAEELLSDGYALPLPLPGIYPNPVQKFIDERPRYVAAARSFSNAYDYARWQGHMEARRQLAHDLGLTIPYELGDTARPVPLTMTPAQEQHKAMVAASIPTPETFTTTKGINP